MFKTPINKIRAGSRDLVGVGKISKPKEAPPGVGPSIMPVQNDRPLYGSVPVSDLREQASLSSSSSASSSSPQYELYTYENSGVSLVDKKDKKKDKKSKNKDDNTKENMDISLYVIGGGILLTAIILANR